MDFIWPNAYYIALTNSWKGASLTTLSGAKVLETVLAGNQYVRSFRGTLILCNFFFKMECIFWNNDDQFNEIKEKLKGLSSNLIEKNKVQCCANYEECEREIDLLKSKYNMHIKDCASSPELWNTGI